MDRVREASGRAFRFALTADGSEVTSSLGMGGLAYGAQEVFDGASFGPEERRLFERLLDLGRVRRTAGSGGDSEVGAFVVRRKDGKAFVQVVGSGRSSSISNDDLHGALDQALRASGGAIGDVAEVSFFHTHPDEASPLSRGDEITAHRVFRRLDWDQQKQLGLDDRTIQDEAAERLFRMQPEDQVAAWVREQRAARRALSTVPLHFYAVGRLQDGIAVFHIGLDGADLARSEQ